MNKSLFLLFCCASWAACLPQGAQRGGIIPGTAVMGAAGDAKAGDTSQGDGSVDAAEDRSADALPNDPPPVVASSGPNPMPAGTAAPIHEVPDAYFPFLEGGISRDCIMPGGKTSVRVWGHIKKKRYAAFQAKMYELHVYYKKDASDTGYHVLVIGFQQAPQEQEGVTTPQEPLFDYVDFTLLTSDPADLHYYLEGISVAPNLGQELPPEVVPLPSGRTEVEDGLIDAGPAVPPACFDVRMMMGPVKPERGAIDVRTRE